MKIVADESVEARIVAELRKAGHDVRYIAESDAGLSDDDVLNLALAAAAPLVTADKDFGELVFRQHRLSAGVVLLRLAGLSEESKAAAVAEYFAAHSETVAGNFVVLAPGRLRIRSDPRP
jgi:predicted nuclease of predicted toxin-antitoxin system